MRSDLTRAAIVAIIRSLEPLFKQQYDQQAAHACLRPVLLPQKPVLE